MLETERLILRNWRDEDVEPYHAICRDPRVMAYIGAPQTRDEVARFVAGQQELQAEIGYCCWAAERKVDHAVIGFCGLKPGPAGTPIAGKTDAGWRLAHDSWGQGYAREAAAACLAWGFAHLPDESIWAKTVPANARSRSLMLRLGMHYVEGGDFDHPALSEGDPLRRHVLYRINRPA